MVSMIASFFWNSFYQKSGMYAKVTVEYTDLLAPWQMRVNMLMMKKRFLCSVM